MLCAHSGVRQFSTSWPIERGRVAVFHGISERGDFRGFPDGAEETREAIRASGLDDWRHIPILSAKQPIVSFFPLRGPKGTAHVHASLLDTHFRWKLGCARPLKNSTQL